MILRERDSAENNRPPTDIYNHPGGDRRPF